LGLVENAAILHPQEPVDDVVRSLIHDDRDPLFSPLDEFASVLLIRFLQRAIQSHRRKVRPKPAQIVLFRELSHLPRRILTAEGKRPLLANATISQVRWYVKLLNQRHYERTQELNQVVKAMEKYVGPSRGLTVSEVARMEDSD
jgi:hypothetical protein